MDAGNQQQYEQEVLQELWWIEQEKENGNV